jgi:UPF0176 protein
MSFVIATFYHFFDFPGFAAAQQPMQEKLRSLGIKGTILIAPEGLNATIAGSREAIDQYLAYLGQDITHAPIEHKESYSDTQPFVRSKVRLKKEIIGLGQPVAPQHGEHIKTGIHVAAKDWNHIISDPEVMVLDSRNKYEVHLGTFEGAVNPDIHIFKDLPEYVKTHLDPAKHKKIATFCTGGIRCEKFSSWLLDQGFEEVYQLKGGILKYLEEVPEPESKWQGECYVFDGRVAVGHGLTPSETASICQACGHALTPEDRAHPDYIEETNCPHCEHKWR